MKEIWKDIVGYEGLYQASNLGRIKSLSYNRTKQEKTSFKNISACCKGKRKTAGGFKWNYSYEYIETDEKIEEVE